MVQKGVKVQLWILIVAILIVGLSVYFFSHQKVIALQNEIGVLRSDLVNEQNSAADLQNQTSFLKENNANVQTFFKKRAEAIALIDSSYVTYQMSAINFNDAKRYDDLTTILYTNYEIKAYDSDTHIEKLETAITQSSDAVIRIKKALKLLSELNGFTPDSFWAEELNMRIKQATILGTLYASHKQLVESSKNIQEYSLDLNEDAGNAELRKYNNILVPAFNDAVEKTNAVFADLNILWDEELYVIS